jgi:hypothetical protein
MAAAFIAALWFPVRAILRGEKRMTAKEGKRSALLLLAALVFFGMAFPPDPPTWRDRMEARGIQDRDLQDSFHHQEQVECAQRAAADPNGNGASVAACYH